MGGIYMFLTNGLTPLGVPRFLKLWKDKVSGREVIEVTDSIALLIYVTDIRYIVLISEDHVALRRTSNPLGTKIGPVAGRFDNKQTLKSLACSEASEECGAEISEDQVTILNQGVPLALSAGVLTERTYLAYVEIESSQLAPDRMFGLAEEGEQIKRVLFPLEQLDALVYEDIRVMAFIEWFKREKLGR